MNNFPKKTVEAFWIENGTQFIPDVPEPRGLTVTTSKQQMSKSGKLSLADLPVRVHTIKG